MFKSSLAGLIMVCISSLAVAQEQPTNPLALMRADHIMISTDDYDGTVDWYNRILGFEVVREWDIDGYPDVDVGYISANGFMIEVVGTKQAFQDEVVAPDVFTAMSDRVYVHMAFNSADVDGVAAELISRGVELELAPTNFDAAGVRLLFIRDNNGNLIEIVTPLSAYKNK